MASFSITFTGAFPAADLDFNRGDPRDNLRRLQRFISGLQIGAYSATFQTNISGTNAVRAQSEVTATTAGSLGTVINGTTVTTAFTTDQDGTAIQAVADINANTTVNKLVTAVKSVSTKFFVIANQTGIAGNTCTLTVTGTGASATGSGKLAGGAGIDGQPSTYSLA